MEFDFSELKNNLNKIFEEYAEAVEEVKKSATTATAAKVKEETNTVGPNGEVPTFFYEMYHYRLFTDYDDMDNEVCFYQWKTPRQIAFTVGDYIESEFISESEGKWRIKSICCNISPYLSNFEPDPHAEVMVDIDVEFVPY